MHLHNNVLQRPLRQVRYTPILRLLPRLGAHLGVQKEAHPRRYQELQRRCDHSTGAGDRAVLSVLSARVKAVRLRWHFLAQVTSKDNAGTRQETR